MRGIFFQKTTLLVFTLLTLALSFSYVLADYEIINESNSVNIKTESSAEANTGNNKSSGSEIKTGDASAESNIKVEISSSDNGDNNNEVKIEAKAEANGEKVEAKVDSAGDENINIKKEAGSEGSQANVEIEVTDGNQVRANAEQNLLNMEKKGDINKENSKIKSVFISAKETAKSVFKNIADKIKSLFL